MAVTISPIHLKFQSPEFELFRIRAMAGLRLLFTQHAEEMLIERGIDRAWVEATIRKPHTLEADPTRPGVIRAFGRIAERDGRFLRVVYAPSDETVRVLTVFFDRKRRR